MHSFWTCFRVYRMRLDYRFEVQIYLRGLRFFAFALLCFDLAAAGSECNRKAGELISDNRFYLALLEINVDLAELFWIHCGVDMIDAKETLEDLQLYAPEEKSGINNAIGSRSALLATEETQEPFHVLNPEVNRILDCLRHQSLLSLKECPSKNWYTKYLEFFFARTDAPRRRHLLQSSAPVPAPSPAAGSPTSSPSPSPVPSPSDHPSIAPSPVIPFFPNLSGSTSQPTAGGQSSASPGSSTSVQPNKQSGSRKAVVVAVIVTATVSFFFAALIFFCYRCKRSGGRRNDERPLLSLSLSLSNYSIGSTHKLFSPGKSTYEEKRDNQSFNTNLNSNKMAPSLDASYYGESDTFSAPKADTQSVAAAKTSTWDSVPISHSSLKPPPGRLSNPPGVPPLKPPPGRQNILPAKQPPLGNGTPPRPPPPPLVSASSLKVSSGTPRPPPSGPPPPPIPSGIKTGPRPPPPPRSGAPPPRPPPMSSKPLRPSPFAPNPAGEGSETDGSKTKLKPFFWDKVLANPDQSMVWHQIRSGSFQFNEEMIETLFGYAPPERNKNEAKRESSSQDPAIQYVQIIDSKKAQNLSILLRALNVTTEEVCGALQKGNELPSELLQTLFKMAPTSEEEVKLGLFNGDLSRLGPADRFLKVLVDIPFAFKRMESLLFMGTFQEEVSTIQDSFTTLEAACTELRKSRLFLKLLEAVLKTGNRMNVGTFRGGAQAFKLDTLLKLSDVKGTDGKTTLLHFVVLEIIRSEGVKAARTARESQSISTSGSGDLLDDPSLDSEDHYRSLGLQAISGLSSELENVKKAAVLDADSLKGAVAKLGHQMVKARDLFNTDMMKVDEQNGFRIALKSFVQNAEVDIMSLLEEEKRIVALVKSTADYFHGNAGKDEGLRLFVIVRDFLIILDKACKEVKSTPRKPNRKPNGEGSTIKPSSDPRSLFDPRQRLFPAITDRRMDSSSSDDDAP